MKLTSLRELRDDDMGFAYSAAIAFVGLVVIAITWNIMGPMLAREVFDYAENEMKEDGTWDEWGAPSHGLIVFIWNYWPVFLLAAYIVYMFVAGQGPRQY